MMRPALIALCALGFLTGPAAGAVTAWPTAALAISDVAHAVDGNALVVTGTIENRGQAVTGLVIDAEGFSAQGNPVVSGSDGIPWTVPAGGRERFAVRLPLGETLVREYTVQAALARPPYAPLAGARRGVDLALYRPFILSQVRVRGEVAGGWLIVSSRTAGLPVLRVTADVTVLFVVRKAVWLQTVTVDVPADASTTIPIGINAAAVAAVRVTDILLKISW